MNGDTELKTELRELMNKQLGAIGELRRLLSGRAIMSVVESIEVINREMKTFVEPEPEKPMNIA